MLLMTNRLDVSVIERDERASWIKDFRRAGFSNNYIRQFMEEQEERVINSKLGIIISSTLPLQEQILFARPYVVAKMVKELKMSPIEAAKRYDLFQSGVEYQQKIRDGVFDSDDSGKLFEDEVHQVAHEATHQGFLLLRQPRVSLRVPGLLGYAQTKQDQYPA